MSDTKPGWFKRLLIVPPIVVGVLLFMFIKGGKHTPQISDIEEPPHTVRVMTVSAQDFIPVARGYGTVNPDKVWKAIAQVSGRILKVHPRLRDGAIIEAGETLVEIDPVDYQLALAQAKTALAELDIQQSNTERSLEIEQRNLALAQKDFERQQKLKGQGSVAQSSVDSAESKLLSTQLQVQNLKNSLALLPSQKNLQRSKVTQAERDLANTSIKAPFNLRVNGVTIENNQFVSKSQHLFSGDAIDRVEIVAQVSLAELKNLFVENQPLSLDVNSISTGLNQLTGFKPTVLMDIGNPEPARWQAEFERFSDKVDSQTRTMGLVVAVDKPIQKVIPGQRPPLSKGMLVEVRIAGRSQPNRLVIPRSAIRNGKVYVADAEQRLQIRPVKMLFQQDDVAVIESGLEVGDTLVLTDLIPAVPGTLLRLVSDEPMAQQSEASAS